MMTAIALPARVMRPATGWLEAQDKIHARQTVKPRLKVFDADAEAIARWAQSSKDWDNELLTAAIHFGGGLVQEWGQVNIAKPVLGLEKDDDGKPITTVTITLLAPSLGQLDGAILAQMAMDKCTVGLVLRSAQLRFDEGELDGLDGIVHGDDATRNAPFSRAMSREARQTVEHDPDTDTHQAFNMRRPESPQVDPITTPPTPEELADMSERVDARRTAEAANGAGTQADIGEPEPTKRLPETSQERRRRLDRARKARTRAAAKENGNPDPPAAA